MIVLIFCKRSSISRTSAEHTKQLELRMHDYDLKQTTHAGRKRRMSS